MTQGNWIRVLNEADLTTEKPRALKTQGKSIVLFRLNDGDVHALDNRCPHEGYPLHTGMLDQGILTCEWHNWKFEVCGGACILGGEDVRYYPLRIEDGGIFIDVTDPPLDEKRPALYRSLFDAFDDDDWGWAGRTIERLLVAGEPAAEILGRACAWAASHAPYGFDHGLAVAADLSGLLTPTDGTGESTAGGIAPGVPLLQAMNLMAEPNLRRKERTFPAPETMSPPPDGDWSAIETELRRRIEVEDVGGAEAWLQGALRAGAGPEQMFTWLVHAATDHFLGYGHAHIYCVKAEELLNTIGWHRAHPVLTSLVSRITYSTREDKLPYMREYVRSMKEYAGKLPEWAARAHPSQEGRAGDSAADPLTDEVVDNLLAAAVDGDLNTALMAVAAALDAGVAARRIALVMAIAAGYRLLRFDAALEADDTVSEGWLNITHALTHADAVHETLRLRPSTDGLRGLFHSARFVQHLAVCDRPAAERPRLPEPADNPGPDGDFGLAEALRSGDVAGALAAVRGGLRTEFDARSALVPAVLSDRATRPIFVAHHIKTTVAALRIGAAIARDPSLGGRADREIPLLGAVNFLVHPLQERRVTRAAAVSRVFVRDGRMQSKLLGY